MNVNVSVIYTQILKFKKISSCIKRLKFGDKLTFQQMVSCTFSLSWSHCEKKNGLLYYKYEEPVNCSSDTLLCHSKANVPFWVIPARTANSLSFYSPLILHYSDCKITTPLYIKLTRETFIRSFVEKRSLFILTIHKETILFADFFSFSICIFVVIYVLSLNPK